jgi:hypothetical protein
VESRDCSRSHAREGPGCDNANILGHLCGGSEHVRGCSTLDQLLGKE